MDGSGGHGVQIGLSLPPWVFTKTMIVLRSMGLRTIMYLDDMLILAESDTQDQGAHFNTDLPSQDYQTAILLDEKYRTELVWWESHLKT